MRIRFVTSTPLNVVQGSGTFAGIATLAAALQDLGTEVELVTPKFECPVYTARRLWFNEQIRRAKSPPADLIVGFDMDGYRIAGGGRVPHVASIKGVIADELRFEGGMTRLTMSVQAACESIHVRRADAVMTTSRYAARRLEELYGIRKVHGIVPELIDLAGWRRLFAANPAAPDPAKFTVLSVCRFYPRKRLQLLLAAADQLRGRIAGLEVRIVGNGPERARLTALWKKKRLETVVRWLGDLDQASLAAEYGRCDLFCLPSVQEGFGIVFLEAMAAGKPIVAARAAAVPEVVEQGELVEPDSAEALAAAIDGLYRDSGRRAALADAGNRLVERYDAPRVARLFMTELARLL